MGVIDDIYSILDNQRQEQADIFKRFGVEMKEKNHLVLPERFRKEIGELHNRIHFSDLIPPDEGLEFIRPLEDFKGLTFGTLIPPYITEENNET